MLFNLCCRLDGEGLDLLIALVKQIINSLQLDLVVSMFLALEGALFGASLVAHDVMHGESSKRWESQCRARLDRLDEFSFCQVARGLAPEQVLQSTVGNHRRLSFREACLTQEQLKFGK
ncbi:hypothetical protein D9M71_601110 [compost metagenome]